MTNQVIEIKKVMLSKHCTLFCPHCGDETTHYLSIMGDFYICGCKENFVEIDLIEEEIEQ
jgi:hypothetical protein